jgi:hypothetical protein
MERLFVEGGRARKTRRNKSKENTAHEVRHNKPKDGQEEPLNAAQAREYEALAGRLDADADMARRALEMVRNFIIERGLVLYGGLAIDYALRLKGSALYPPGELPDYDFYSPRNVDDAYDLAERLEEAGFPRAGAIRALHAQTMRVRVDFVGVADISYVPPAVYRRLPTLRYQGMRVIHPDFQRADMHLAFCFPFNNPPQEDVFHRFPKDLPRFALLEEHYQVSTGARLGRPEVSAQGATGGAQKKGPAPPGARRGRLPLGWAALHGFAAYAALGRALQELAEMLPDRSPARLEAEETLEGWPSFQSRLRGSALEVEYGLPGGEAAAEPFLLASPWPEEALRRSAAGAEETPRPSKARQRAPLLDLRPASAEAAGTCVYSTHFRLLAVARLGVENSKKDGAAYDVVSAQFLLLHLLVEALEAEGARRDFYAGCYSRLLALLRAADKALGALGEQVGNDAQLQAAYRRLVNTTPFGLTTRVLGDRNYSPAYLIQLAGEKARVGEPADPALAAALPDLSRLPENYYPDKPKYQRNGGPEPRPAYAYDHPLFRRDGRLLEVNEEA